MLDKIKLLIAILLVVGGIAAYYFYAEQAFLYRLLGLLAIIAAAAGLALTTQIGAETLDFGRSAALEVRKAVWPTRRETTQTTLIVIVMVTLIGLMLWLFDMFLGWAIKMLIGQGG